MKDLDRAQKIDERVVNVNSVYREEAKEQLPHQFVRRLAAMGRGPGKIASSNQLHTRGTGPEFYFDLIDGRKGSRWSRKRTSWRSERTPPRRRSRC